MEKSQTVICIFHKTLIKYVRQKKDHDLDQELFNKIHGLETVGGSASSPPIFSWTGEDAKYAYQKLFEHPDFNNLTKTAFTHEDETERQRAREQIKKIFFAIAKERVEQKQDET